MPLLTHEDCFDASPAEARPLLVAIQQEVERRVPGATRCVAYKMPAFRQQRVFFYFAAFRKHIGIYPPVIDDAALAAETARFRGPKGNLSFSYGQALPLELIGRVAAALAAQYGRR